MKRIAMFLVTLVLLIGGCSGGDSSPLSNDSNLPPANDSASPPNQMTEPTAISQQTRVVLAEMFTGDW